MFASLLNPDTHPQLDEIIYVKWENKSNLYYLGQIKSVDTEKKTYDVEYGRVFQRKYSTVTNQKSPNARKENKPIGKTFFDSGDYVPGRKKTQGGFKPGEFTVLCYQSGRNPTYWCERLTNKDDDTKKYYVEFFVLMFRK